MSHLRGSGAVEAGARCEMLNRMLGPALDAMSDDEVSDLARGLTGFPHEIFRRHGAMFVRGSLLELLASRQKAQRELCLTP